jgi:hypothetical protein
MVRPSLLLVCVAVLAVAGCATETSFVPDGTYYGFEPHANLSPDDPYAIWFHRNVMSVRGGKVRIDKSPRVFTGGRVLASASDGGFRTYEGSIEVVSGRTLVALRQITCEYCEPPPGDGPLPSKRIREYIVGFNDDGSFELDHVSYSADERRPYWLPREGPVFGAWDVGNFDNEVASYWAYEFADSKGPGLLIEVLENLLPRDLMEVESCRRTLAAAELIAAFTGSPDPALPKELREWVDDTRLEVDRDLWELTRAAVEQIRKDSGLRELWEQSDEFERWQAVVSDLQGRLERSGLQLQDLD